MGVMLAGTRRTPSGRFAVSIEQARALAHYNKRAPVAGDGSQSAPGMVGGGRNPNNGLTRPEDMDVRRLLRDLHAYTRDR